VFGIFPADDVVSLTLSSRHRDVGELRLVAYTISQLPALTALFLRDIASAPFLQYLERDVPDPSIMPTTYPALRYLEFIECDVDVAAPTTLYNCSKRRSELSLGPEKLKVDLRGL
jgi:hypothetical protein